MALKAHSPSDVPPGRQAQCRRPRIGMCQSDDQAYDNQCPPTLIRIKAAGFHGTSLRTPYAVVSRASRPETSSMTIR